MTKSEAKELLSYRQAPLPKKIGLLIEEVPYLDKYKLIVDGKGVVYDSSICPRTGALIIKCKINEDSQSSQTKP